MDRSPAQLARRYALAAFLAFHVAAVVVPSLPAPVFGDDRRGYESKEGQRELTRWRLALGRVGVTVTNDELAEHTLRVSRAWLAARRNCLRPFKPYKEYAGVRQSWRMFSGVNEEPDRLSVEVKVDGEWTLIFRAGEDESWNRSLLRHEFGRSMLSRYGEERRYGSRFKQFAKFLAVRAADDFPDAERLRVTIDRVENPSPAERRAGAVATFRRAKRKSVAIPR